LLKAVLWPKLESFAAKDAENTEEGSGAFPSSATSALSAVKTPTVAGDAKLQLWQTGRSEKSRVS
jgi:hypothetical protein